MFKLKLSQDPSHGAFLVLSKKVCRGRELGSGERPMFEELVESSLFIKDSALRSEALLESDIKTIKGRTLLDKSAVRFRCRPNRCCRQNRCKGERNCCKISDYATSQDFRGGHVSAALWFRRGSDRSRSEFEPQSE